jgi:hypothetical protein
MGREKQRADASRVILANIHTPGELEQLRSLTRRWPLP